MFVSATAIIENLLSIEATSAQKVSKFEALSSILLNKTENLEAPDNGFFGYALLNWVGFKNLHESRMSLSSLNSLDESGAPKCSLFCIRWD